MIHCPEINQFHEEAKMIVDEATACEIKYLAEDSKDRCEIGFIISGIMAIILISNPSHAINQLELNIVVVVPKKTPEKRVSFINGFNSKGKVVFHFWGMNLRA